MAHPDSRGSNLPDTPHISHRISFVPDILSPASPPLGYSSNRDSVVSILSATDGHERYSEDEFDISHVPLQPSRSFGIAPPTDGLRRNNQLSPLFPETLRIRVPSPPPSNSFNPFSRNTNISYEPLSSAEMSIKRPSSSTVGSKRFSVKRKISLLAGKQSSIPDEDFDVSLLSSAMPMAVSKQSSSYITVEGVEQDDEPGNGGLDLSSFTGPMSLQDEAQLRELNRQEASGILTGGLGIGLKPDTTLSSSDLYTNASQTPLTPVGLSRGMTFRAPGLTRTRNIRNLGQIEANRRGEIIEVIMEDDPAVDISSIAGGTSRPTVDFEQILGSNKSVKSAFQASNVEVFYPQENWKPFSMRWQYLASLILISVALAGSQEYMLQKSLRAPLFEFKSAESIKTWDYFCFKYLPTMVAVSFGVLWQNTDFEVKRLEAYYQLSKDGGALAAESINVDYITFVNFLRPLRALRFKHYAVAVSSVANLLAVSLVPTLQSASVKLSPDRATREKDPLGIKKIYIDAVFSRCLTVVLMIVALLGCVLLWQLQRRRSGLVADVKGIAGIAAMANRSHILMDFKNMDTATPEMIHHTLKSHRYTLRNSSLAPEEKVPLTQEEKDKYDQHKRPGNPHPLMLRLIVGVPFVIGMMLVLVFIPIILFTKANVLTDKAPWLLTGLAVCIKLAWGSLETDVRMMEPFYILSRRHASPKVLTLDYTSMAFGLMPVSAFLNGHVLVGLVGLGSVLTEVLTVCATSFSTVAGDDFTGRPPRPASSPQEEPHYPELHNGMDAGEETFTSFWVSFSLAAFVITFLCLVATLVYFRRRHAFLPRQPNSIASILAFIHQSKMLYDFVGTEKMNHAEMVTRLVGIGKTYGLGWFTGRDGEMHCGVDEEELLSNYKHGDDARNASKPWTTNWSQY